MIKCSLPRSWIEYDIVQVAADLAAAKAAVLALTTIPYQRSWADKLQDIQLKREVAGTSRIEGADFTENELDAAMQGSPGNLATRSQRQAAAAVATYRWIIASYKGLRICEVSCQLLLFSSMYVPFREIRSHVV